MEFLNPLGLPQMLLLLAMMGFAMWKRGWLRVILSICLIIWGAFATQYDYKIAAPLLSVGTLLFIDAVMRLMGREITDA